MNDIYQKLSKLVPKRSASGSSHEMKSKSVDRLEVLSFSVALHLYMAFYLFLFKQGILQMLIYQIFATGALYGTFQYNFFSFFTHPFLHHHLHDIVIPQTVYTVVHLYLLTSGLPLYILFTGNIGFSIVSSQYFGNVEHEESRKIQSLLNIFVYLTKYFVHQMILLLF